MVSPTGSFDRSWCPEIAAIPHFVEQFHRGLSARRNNRAFCTSGPARNTLQRASMDAVPHPRARSTKYRACVDTSPTARRNTVAASRSSQRAIQAVAASGADVQQIVGNRDATRSLGGGRQITDAPAGDRNVFDSPVSVTHSENFLSAEAAEAANDAFHRTCARDLVAERNRVVALTEVGEQLALGFRQHFSRPDSTGCRSQSRGSCSSPARSSASRSICHVGGTSGTSTGTSPSDSTVFRSDSRNTAQNRMISSPGSHSARMLAAKPPVAPLVITTSELGS